MAVAAIRQRVADGVEAVRAKDIDAVMALYASNIASFDIGPPLRYGGADNKRRAWQEVFAAYAGPIAYEIHALNVTTAGFCRRTWADRSGASGELRRPTR